MKTPIAVAILLSGAVSFPVLADSPANEKLISHARTILAATYGDECNDRFSNHEDIGDKVYSVTWKKRYHADESPAPKGQLVKLYCDAGAYNNRHSWFIVDQDGRLSLISFAAPSFTAIYDNEDHSSVKSLTVDGMIAYSQLVNSEFSPELGEISMVVYWRGVGDASTNGTWKLFDGSMVLKTFEVDASYDGKTTPKRIYSAQ